MSVSMNVTDTIFTKLALAWQFTVQSSYTKFHKNPTNSSVTDTRTRTDGGLRHILLCKERLKNCTIPTQCFCVIQKQTKQVGLHNREAVCLLWGGKWIFKNRSISYYRHKLVATFLQSYKSVTYALGQGFFSRLSLNKANTVHAILPHSSHCSAEVSSLFRMFENESHKNKPPSFVMPVSM